MRSKRAGWPACWHAEREKTRVHSDRMKEVDAHIEVNILSQKEPTDIAGMPVLIDGELRYAPPAWARRAQKVAESGRLAIVFNDEFTWAPPAVQAASLRVINERWVGELKLHAHVRPPTLE